MADVILTNTEVYIILQVFLCLLCIFVLSQQKPHITLKEPLFSGYVVYKEMQVPASSIAPDKRRDNYDHTTYMFRCWEDGPAWTPSLAKALHFVRKEDADSFASEDPEDAHTRPAINFKSYYLTR